MTFKKGEGGRKKGSKNKLTLARLQMRQEALRLLSEDLPEDAFKGDAKALLQRVYKDPNFDAQMRLDTAAKAAPIEAKEVAEANAPQYVVVMPLPVKDLDEWRSRYEHEMPNAAPEEREYHEKLAIQILNKDPTSIPPQIVYPEDNSK